MPNDISTRRFEPVDTDAVRSLIRRAAADGELVGFNRSEVRGWLNYLPEDGDRTLVVVRNGAVIEFLSYGADGLIVAPEHRRLGAGRALGVAVLELRPELELSQ